MGGSYMGRALQGPCTACQQSCRFCDDAAMLLAHLRCRAVHYTCCWARLGLAGRYAPGVRIVYVSICVCMLSSVAVVGECQDWPASGGCISPESAREKTGRMNRSSKSAHHSDSWTRSPPALFSLRSRSRL